MEEKNMTILESSLFNLTNIHKNLQHEEIPKNERENIEEAFSILALNLVNVIKRKRAKNNE